MSASTRASLGLRLPAFGKDLLAARERGLAPERGWNGAHVLVIVDDWRLAANRFRLVVAPDVPPETLDFKVCAGLDVILVYSSRRTDTERLKTAIRAVLRGQPAALQVFDVQTPHHAWLVKSHQIGIEHAEFM